MWPTDDRARPSGPLLAAPPHSLAFDGFATIGITHPSLSNSIFLGDHMAIAVIGSWVVIGVIIGFIASKIVPTSGDDPGMGIGITAAGALAVAAVYSWIRGSGPTAFNLPILICAAIGAAAATIIWHIVRSRFVTHEKYVPRRSY